MAFLTGAAPRAYQLSLRSFFVIQLFKKDERRNLVQAESAAATDWTAQFAAAFILDARAELKGVLFLIPDEHDDGC